MTDQLTLATYLLLTLIGFAAGMLDSIVGGGGLIGTPAIANLFPHWPILQVIGTNRTSSIVGTSVAAWNYFRRVRLDYQLVLCACIGALSCSYAGANLATQIPQDYLKIVVFTVIVFLAIYTVFKKELGLTENRRFKGKSEWWAALGIGCACGFYNGLIGPGTGTLLVFAFVSILGFDFLKSSALAKVTNVSADISSFFVLLTGGYVVLAAALPLMLGNIVGSYSGSRLAILKGSAFIRWVFLAVVLAFILRLVLTA
jgi:uncharacterized protein